MVSNVNVFFCFVMVIVLGAHHSFMTSYYWTFTTMTTTGYGDVAPVTLPQTVYNVFVSFLAPTIFATILAKFASYVKVSNVSPDNMEHRLTTVQQFLRTSVGDVEVDVDVCVGKENDRGTGGIRKSIAEIPDVKMHLNAITRMKKIPSFRTNFSSQKYKVIPSFSMKDMNAAEDRKVTLASLLGTLTNEYYDHVSSDEVAGLYEGKIIRHGVPDYLVVSHCLV